MSAPPITRFGVDGSVSSFFVDGVEVIVRPSGTEANARARKLARLLAEHAGSGAVRELLNGREE